MDKVDEIIALLRRKLDKLELYTEDIEPEVNAYLLSRKSNNERFRITISMNLHDEVGNTTRKKFSITFPDDVDTEKKAKSRCELTRSLAQEIISEKFKETTHHMFISTLEKSIKNKREAVKRNELRGNTVDNYEYRLSMIKRYFDDKNYTVEQITPAIINDYIEWALREGKANGKGGLSPRSVSDAHGLLYEFFNTQVKEGRIALNPCTTTKVPKKKNTTKKEEVWLDVDDYKQLLNWLEDENTKFKYKKLIDILKITIAYGLRKEELLGLRWDVITWGKNGKIDIKRTRTLGKQIYDIEGVKSSASERSYPLTVDINNILAKIKQKQEQAGIDTEYIFAWEADDINKQEQVKPGAPYRPDYIGKLWKKAMIDYSEAVEHDWTGLTFHKLRHSCASVLFDKGWTLEQVQKWIGHEDSEITRRIYIHIKENWKFKMADQVNDIWASINE